MLIKAVFERLALPSMVGYFAVGLASGWAGEQIGFMTRLAEEGFEFLARAGIVLLLFASAWTATRRRSCASCLERASRLPAG